MVKSRLGSAKIKISCTRGCGLVLDQSLMREHVANECPNRIVACKWGCGHTELFFKEKEVHELKECMLRHVPCVEGCGEIVAGKSSL